VRNFKLHSKINFGQQIASPRRFSQGLGAPTPLSLLRHWVEAQVTIIRENGLKVFFCICCVETDIHTILSISSVETRSVEMYPKKYQFWTALQTHF